MDAFINIPLYWIGDPAIGATLRFSKVNAIDAI